ncbi:hypothetical protein [Oleiharenicola lentus]|uniref:hypothetical protein n=1 Tax=Oleiharenicola lentus TaxID=2508720 RepID=UPI003F67FBFF
MKLPAPLTSLRALTRISLFALVVALAPALRAQWKTETYALRGGWNAIYLHGDASHTTPTELFRNFPTVLQVWRWNPNPDRVGFTTAPSAPNAASNEWTIWNRNDTSEQQLTAMIGQSAYLVYCSGTSATVTNVTIPQRPQPPAAIWLVTGANFQGFPADASRPVFNNYFATFPIATTSPSKIYKYIGGDLTTSNPMQIVPASEPVDRNLAYWFEATTVGNFTAPIEYELPGTTGLAFGRTSSVMTVGVMNRTTSAMTLTFSLQNSEPAPTNQTAITGTVPLTRRVFNSTTNTYTETAITGSFTVSVPASGRVDFSFGINRSLLTGNSSAHYASILRVKDSGNFTDVYLPVSAQTASAAGLWIGDAQISAVTSTVVGSPGSTTTRSFPLRMLIHVDGAGVARLLSQAYVGTLKTDGNLPGVTLREDNLLPSAKSSALRLVSSHLPLDRAIASTSGSFAVGSTLVHSFEVPFNDATNPFVHQYHPDHDNHDARGVMLSAGVESYRIVRTCRFTFTSEPPAGTSVSGWGTTIHGGTYSETIEGINKQPLTVGGIFALRRVSEIAELLP